ncbi:hypothetical protein LG197_26215 [Pseudomonas asiatica]|uniref:hypothetical protein n=1 Tax=Pseudomonas asiatica TaxID=2219225 RepID=UPI0023683A7F|nr:hypothetical protein [Pseudomonas asiatica]WDM88048.1 hypothetical protein LG197_26215 [Pseudomonas asiatica]
MAFSDLFTADNMNALMSDPRMVLGLQLMAQGRQGSSSQAIGQAGSQAAQLMGEQRRSQELAQYRNNLARMQAEELDLRKQSAQAKAAQQAQYQERLQDPSFLDQLSPTARQMAGLGVSPDDLIRAIGVDNLAQHRDATLAQQAQQFATRESRIGANQGGSSAPRAPAARAFVDQPLGGDMYQRMQYDPATGGYREFGQPFNKHSQRQATDNSADPLDDVVQQVMGGGLEALPGNKPLADYAPGQPAQQPLGVLPLAASGGGMANPALKAATADTRVPGQPKIATPMTKAEYDALPPGARYIDPVSGKTATKRG